MRKLLYIGGDGYTPELVQPFFSYLQLHGITPIFVPLREEVDTCSYEQLEPDSYCDYIDGYADGCDIGYGISKGSHWLRVYASKRPGKFKHIVLVEETTMNPSQMVKFEEQRGNDFIYDYKRQQEPLYMLDSTHKALDAIVSDRGRYFPKCPIDIVWTSRDNQNRPYTPDVIHMKREYVRYLRNGGCRINVHNVDSDHCIDTHEKWFGWLLKLIIN